MGVARVVVSARLVPENVHHGAKYRRLHQMTCLAVTGRLSLAKCAAALWPASMKLDVGEKSLRASRALAANDKLKKTWKLSCGDGVAVFDDILEAGQALTRPAHSARQ